MKKEKEKKSQLVIPIEMNETIYRATQMQVQETISDKDTSTKTQVNLMKHFQLMPKKPHFLH